KNGYSGSTIFSDPSAHSHSPAQDTNNVTYSAVVLKPVVSTPAKLLLVSNRAHYRITALSVG
ncbi:MAG: hypothetical protein KDE46_31725, partial [Caldilineaceae bacterium]|nr:hypothetical protein [Caldilineaceae bacterium]